MVAAIKFTFISFSFTPSIVFVNINLYTLFPLRVLFSTSELSYVPVDFLFRFSANTLQFYAKATSVRSVHGISGILIRQKYYSNNYFRFQCVVIGTSVSCEFGVNAIRTDA